MALGFVFGEVTSPAFELSIESLQSKELSVQVTHFCPPPETALLFPRSVAFPHKVQNQLDNV